MKLENVWQTVDVSSCNVLGKLSAAVGKEQQSDEHSP